ncbi:transmembrane protein 16K [Thecamonas trahens ATCC 50062]|uniref:Transmembrane protein 16K n=1 Tax=Thecamonas trahens ATCC 50062 TaxID=461836 RepID=A0A0L0D8P7_THETB|nr:transmembrane protein 16K [Thecamonas trahens ATCC 50062]KNC48456.1 transmembrane protein 16K [Thecamonas trahens ATCC 50062]|eukprot:XP_013758569.1 transmembrane protein 16K [Thecamonas trahens ATCC 50062]
MNSSESGSEAHWWESDSESGSAEEHVPRPESALQLCLTLHAHGLAFRVREALKSRAERGGSGRSGSKDVGRSARARMAAVGEATAQVLRGLGLEAKVEVEDGEAECEARGRADALMRARQGVAYVLVGPSSRKALEDAFAAAQVGAAEAVRILTLCGSARVQQMVLAVVRSARTSAALAETMSNAIRAGDGEADATDATLNELVDLPLIGALESTGLLADVCALHDKASQAELFDALASFKLTLSLGALPLDAINNYFGSEIAFYFAWLHMYTVYLVAPALLGLLVFVHQWLADASFVWPLIPYGICLSLWSSVFLQMWRRRQSAMAYKWLDGELELPATRWEHRPGFEGEWIRHEPSGLYVLQYPTYIRYAKYAASAVVLFLFVAVVAGSIWGVQELTRTLEAEYPACYDWGHIKASLLGNESPPHVTAEALWWCQVIRIVPGLVSAVAIQVLSRVYTVVARRINAWENYKSETSARNHLLAKLFVFQFVNHFAALFYLAFYLRDWDKLRQRLLVVLVFNQVLDNFKETLAPAVITLLRASVPLAAAPVARDSPHAELIDQTNRPRYDDTISDFLEMLIQTAYVTFFGAAFPLAAVLALANNLAEIRVDAHKLCSPGGYARPFARAAAGIGVWLYLLDFISIVGVLVNTALLVMTTNSIDEWCARYGWPEMLGVSAAVLKIGGVFVAEHAILGIKLALHLLIPPVPGTVKWSRIIAATPKAYLHEKSGPYARSMVRKAKIA